MPGNDKTGPQGQGPLTGRGLGYCAGNPNPGSFNNFSARWISGRGRIFGRGLGQGFRGGRGPYFGYYPHEISAYPSLTKKDMLNILEVQAKNLQNELENIQKRISELGPVKNNQQQKDR